MTRTGLAPLELVLSLFFLLVMMALMINFGTTAPWHIRGQIAARHGVWRALSGRTGVAYPNPSNWWPPATVPTVTGMPLNPAIVGPIWDQADLAASALRGTAVVDPATGKQVLLQDRRYLEMTSTVEIGSASLTKAMPLLPNMRKASINPLHPVLDHFWRFSDMTHQSGGVSMRNNDDWRMIGWYMVRPEEVGDGDLLKLFMAYQAADQAILQNGDAGAITVLDRDPDFIEWGWTPPDEYAKADNILYNQCETSPLLVNLNLIQGRNGLIVRIQGPRGGGRGGVPETYTRDLLRLWQAEKAWSEGPPLRDAARLARAKENISQLEQFLGGLN